MDHRDADGDAEAETMIVGRAKPDRAAGPTPARRRTTARQPASGREKLLAGALLAVLITLGALLVVPAAVGREWRTCPSQGASSADVRQIAALAEAELQAFVTADVAQLNSVLAADAILITPSGDRWSREDLTESIASRTLEFETFRPRSPIDVRLDCAAAYVTYRSEIDVSFGAERWRHDAWHTDVYELLDGKWRVVRSQTTAVGGFPPADR